MSRGQKFLYSMAALLFFMLSVILLLPHQVMAEQKEGCTISIALDVSGSMNSRDAEHSSIEVIKLFTDICKENDYLIVTAYNDSIAYQSDVVSMADEKAKEKLVADLDKLEFSGETDNGLGLRAATDKLLESEAVTEKSFVLLVTDGNTDLEKSSTNRTIEDSQRDLNESAELAKNQGVPIYALMYAAEYFEDTGILSVITASTGGKSVLVDNTQELVQIMIETFFTAYNGGKSNFVMDSGSELLKRGSFSLDTANEQGYLIVYSSEKILDSEILSENQTVNTIKRDHYLITEIEPEKESELSVVFSVENPTVAVMGTVKAEQKQENEPVEEQETEVSLPEPKPAVPIETEEIKPQLSIWEKYKSLWTTAIILVILLITVILSVWIVRKILFQKEEAVPVLEGFIEAKFIDLKSKNESKDIKWNLKEYPSAGVTLAELFAGKKIKEELNDIDKICFYPSDKKDGLILVHCMEGGVFIGDQLIRANKPAYVRTGDVIYLSFAENASEIALRYSIAEL